MALHDIPSSIAADGSGDVTAEVQAWFDSLPDGTADDPTIVDFGRACTPRCYKITGPLLATGRPFFEVRTNGHKFVVTVDAPTDGTDATSIIQSQIDAAPDGATIVFPVGRNEGQYRSDRTLNVINRTGLTIQGPSPDNPAVIWTDKTGFDVGQVYAPTGGSIRSHWQLFDCTCVTMRCLRVEGSNTYRDAKGYTRWSSGGLSYEGEHGFVTRGCKDILIEDCSVDSVGGDGFSANNNTRGEGIEGLSLLRGSTTSNGRHGFSTQNAKRVLVDGLNVVKGGTVGVSVEPNGTQEVIEDVEIRNCTIDTRTIAFANTGARGTDNLWIHDNVVTHAITSWPMFISNNVHGTRRSNITVERNRQTFMSTPGHGIVMNYVDGAVVRDNYINMSPSTQNKAGVQFKSVTGGVVTGNDFGKAPAVYRIDEVVHGKGVESCGNLTAAGPNQPVPCQ